MKRLLSHIIGAGLGFWIAATFVPEVIVALHPDSSFFSIALTQPWQLFLLLGIILGLLNFFVKPILDTITLPLQIITLGLFGFIINMGLIWILDIAFGELSVPLLYPLLWTTLVIWTLNFLLTNFVLKSED